MTDEGQTQRRHIAVLMTCHNRRALTLASIGAVVASAAQAGADLSIHLVDDGSSDGTGEAVRARFPQVKIQTGDGNLFWNRGMWTAWQAAQQDVPDFYLWLNDDLEMLPAAIGDALAGYDAAGVDKRIMVGKTIDPDSGQVTYGVLARDRGWSRLRFRKLAPGETSGVTMNGNFVLIPARAVQDIGISDPVFRHGVGDMDYGLRAHEAGYRIIELAEPVGRQTYNTAAAAQSTAMRLSEIRTVMTHPKRVPLGEWLYFTRRHGGPLWPVNFVYRYVKMLRNGYARR